MGPENYYVFRPLREEGEEVEEAKEEEEKEKEEGKEDNERMAALRPHTPQHIRGGWSAQKTDTSEPVFAYGSQNMVTVPSGFQEKKKEGQASGTKGRRRRKK
jgi:hypothetical protein